MKYGLLERVKCVPYTTDVAPAIDRTGFMSAVFAVSVGEISGTPTASALKVLLEHCDTQDGKFSEVIDPMRFVGGAPDSAEAGTLYNVDMDLLACKRFIKVSAKIVFEGGTNPTASLACALVLGDKTANPV